MVERERIVEFLKGVLGADVSQLFQILNNGRDYCKSGFVIGNYCADMTGHEYINIQAKFGEVPENLLYCPNKGKYKTGLNFPENLVTYSSQKWDVYLVYFEKGIPLACIHMDRCYNENYLFILNRKEFNCESAHYYKSRGEEDPCCFEVSRDELKDYKNPLKYRRI